VGAEHHHDPPPSAGPGFEPYGLRVHLGPAAAGASPERFLIDLLGEIASGCEAEGATVIGHLKGLLFTADGTLACNLTSTRTGAHCRRLGAQPVSLSDGADLELSVLVYGLPSRVIDTVTRTVLKRFISAHTERR
jgi:hypothetical protein